MNIEILGPRGCGKTTFGRELGTLLSSTYISVGEVSRTEINNQTALGTLMKYYIDNDILYPEGFLVPLIKEELEGTINNGGFILDGYPRQESEANEMIQICKDLKLDIDAIIELSLPYNNIIQRVRSRGRIDDTKEHLLHAFTTYMREKDIIINILTAGAYEKAFRLDASEIPSVLIQSALHYLSKLGAK